MQQLSFDLPAPAPITSEPEPTALDYVNVMEEVLGVEPPERRGLKFFHDTTVAAVLELNEAERALGVTHPDSPSIETLKHAQDWLCRDLPEWMHFVLREL